MTEITLRVTVDGDQADLMALYPRAFPDEDLLPLVSALLDGQQRVLSLAAVTEGGLAGHIAFTICGAGGALLAPLAVTPEHQRKGIGTALIRAGLSRLQAQGIGQVFVLGDPSYYHRFGFATETRVLPPYPMPSEWADAWASLCFPGATPLPSGLLPLPPFWLEPSLWQP